MRPSPREGRRVQHHLVTHIRIVIADQVSQDLRWRGRVARYSAAHGPWTRAGDSNVEDSCGSRVRSVFRPPQICGDGGLAHLRNQLGSFLRRYLRILQHSWSSRVRSVFSTSADLRRSTLGALAQPAGIVDAVATSNSPAFLRPSGSIGISARGSQAEKGKAIASPRLRSTDHDMARAQAVDGASGPDQPSKIADSRNKVQKTVASLARAASTLR